MTIQEYYPEPDMFNMDFAASVLPNLSDASTFEVLYKITMAYLEDLVQILFHGPYPFPEDANYKPQE